MKKYTEFLGSLEKSAIVGLIALTIVILPIWIATGTPDFASRFSFFLLSIALPMLILGFVVCQIPEQFVRSKVNKALRFTIFIIGVSFASTGVFWAIWHVSQTVAIAFAISFVICGEIFVYFAICNIRLIRKDKNQVDDLKQQSDELDKKFGEFEKHFKIHTSNIKVLADKYEIT